MHSFFPESSRTEITWKVNLKINEITETNQNKMRQEYEIHALIWHVTKKWFSTDEIRSKWGLIKTDNNHLRLLAWYEKKICLVQHTFHSKR